MNKNLKYILIILSALIAIIGLFFIIQDNNLENINPVFLQALGNWSTSDRNDIIFNILFFDHKKNSIFDRQKDLQISFDSDIEVENYVLNRGSSYKDMRLYSLEIYAKSKEIGKHSISKIYLTRQGETILDSKIGVIGIYVIGDRHNDLELVEHTGSSETFNKYLFSVRNSSDKPIIIDEIQAGSFEQYVDSIDVYINGEIIENTNNIELDPNYQLDCVIQFTGEHNHFDVFYFAPLLIYRVVNATERHEFAIPHAIYGLPVYEKTLEKIYAIFSQD